MVYSFLCKNQIFLQNFDRVIHLHYPLQSQFLLGFNSNSLKFENINFEVRIMKRILIILTTIFFIGCEEDPTMYTLSVTSNPTEGGTINPTTGEYEEGTEVTITVTPNSNYEFEKWSGSWSGSETPLTITMDSDKNLVGNFKLMDSDGDGVSDDVDTCSDTRDGIPVDDNGCMLNPIYLDDNGITIKSYEWGEVGDTGEVNGITYTIISEGQLRGMISNNEDLSKVCTSKINDMRDLFRGENDNKNTFNGDISNWDVSSVTDMTQMFYNSNFNGDISNWDVSSVISMMNLFGQNEMFNGDISNWDVSSVEDMTQMFLSSVFNKDISNWDVSSVINMRNMFRQNRIFNLDISNWDVSSVNDMSHMFQFTVFNGDISNWDVSNVIDMSHMFSNQSEFNGDISNWDVSNVKYMNGMFYISKFNRDISNWDVSSVEDMTQMFFGNFDGGYFNQNLSSWNVSSVNQCSDFSKNNPQWSLPKPIFTNCNPN